MVKDLDRHLLIEGRTTRGEVLKLLGKPRSEYKDSVTYTVGDDGFGVDSASFTIYFTADDLMRRGQMYYY